MGGSQSAEARRQEQIDGLLATALAQGKKPEWANDDALSSPKALAAALKRVGLESTNLICAIDFTASNKTSGAETFGGRSLHALDVPGGNPYEQAVCIIGTTLSSFDDDGLIPVFGFGDQASRNFDTTSLGIRRGFESVLCKYRRSLKRDIVLSGPTSFAPVIRKSIDIVKKSGNQFHVLMIIADGQVSDVLGCKAETIKAIVDASNVPLSIVVVGVGDGPFDQMEAFDDELPQRRFDNLQFVNFAPFQAALASSSQVDNKSVFEAAFALCALQELPSQYNDIVRLGLLENDAHVRAPAAEEPAAQRQRVA